jgi:hypothetical protein
LRKNNRRLTAQQVLMPMRAYKAEDELCYQLLAINNGVAKTCNALLPKDRGFRLSVF